MEKKTRIPYYYTLYGVSIPVIAYSYEESIRMVVKFIQDPNKLLRYVQVQKKRLLK